MCLWSRRISISPGCNLLSWFWRHVIQTECVYANCIDFERCLSIALWLKTWAVNFCLYHHALLMDVAQARQISWCDQSMKFYVWKQYDLEWLLKQGISADILASKYLDYASQQEVFWVRFLLQGGHSHFYKQYQVFWKKNVGLLIKYFLCVSCGYFE